MRTDIPISKVDIQNFLTTAGNVNSPIKKLLGSSGLADLFPADSSGDINGAKLVEMLFQKYSDILFNGVSWDMDLNVRYTGPVEKTLTDNLINAYTNSSYYNSNININSYQPMTPYDMNTSNNTFSMYNTNDNTSYSQFSQLNQQYLQPSALSDSKPAHFDWQQRANFIYDSIQKQGLNPQDFGCLRPDEYVSDNFSWRGYAKMVCGRLATSYDTGLPETCGCPPLNWPGWKQ